MERKRPELPDSQDQTQNAVRQMMEAEKRQSDRLDHRHDHSRARSEPTGEPGHVALGRRVARDHGFGDLPPEGPRAGKTGDGAVDLIARIKQVRPSRRLLFWGALAVVMVLRPWLVPGVILLTVWIGLIVYFTLGPDRITDLVTAGWEWFASRKPEAAERVLTRLQHGADRLDGWLARLPERWTDGLYLPDLGRSEIGREEDQNRPDPFERLARESGQVNGTPGRA